MGSTAECREQRKESVNLNIEKQKSPNMSYRENKVKTKEQGLRDLWN